MEAQVPPTRPSWVSAVLDLAAEDADRAATYWAAVTGYRLAPANGAERHVPLAPDDGDPFLRVRRARPGAAGGVRLELHVPDPVAAAEHAVRLGARAYGDHGALLSPAGLELRFTGPAGSDRPRPVTWPGGHAWLLDQVCIDVPHDRCARELRFWAALTGWPERPSATHEELVSLERPAGVPLRLLLQRLGTDDGGDRARAHLDWATTDRPAETARHVALGAAVRDVRGRWTVLEDPCGRVYCITDRDPATGR